MSTDPSKGRATDGLMKMVDEDWFNETSREQSDLRRLLLKMASNIEFTINCIEDLRKEIGANREEIKKLKHKTKYMR